ncbi:MAG: hypothetical protein HY888_01265 [Deltaproteobacteria bacterium]|nr:hypothetical protein [Deltaproteobacteria bacterium]
MTYRLGTVKQLVPVALPRPRDVLSNDFIAIQKELTQMVMEEQMRYQKDEAGSLRV